jgi:hypothetical protein
VSTGRGDELLSELIKVLEEMKVLIEELVAQGQKKKKES